MKQNDIAARAELEILAILRARNFVLHARNGEIADVFQPGELRIMIARVVNEALEEAKAEIECLKRQLDEAMLPPDLVSRPKPAEDVPPPPETAPGEGEKTPAP